MFRRPGPVLLCCLLAVASAGCLSWSDDSLADDVQDQLEAAEPPEEVVATQNFTVENGNNTITATQHVWYHRDGRSRTESVPGEGTDGSRIISVNDGEQIWTYLPAEETVRVRPVNETDENRTSVNALEQFYGLHDEMLTDMEITSVEETTFGGHDVYHLVVEPDDDDSDDDSISVFDVIADPFSSDESDDGNGEEMNGTVPDRVELWFDQEYLFPLRMIAETDGEVTEVVFRNVSFEPGIPEERFTFEPPDNATVEEVDVPDIEQYDDVESANEAVPFELSEPSFVPEGYERNDVSVSAFEDENRTNAALFYQAGEQEFLVVQVTDGEPRFEVEGESVEFAGMNGTFSSDEQGGNQLAWECNGLRYTVSAGDLDRETVLQVAESIDC